jgi:SLBB domain
MMGPIAIAEEESSPLYVHEWIILSLLIALIFGLTFITALKQSLSTLAAPVREKKTAVEVFVKGAVEYPGIYTLPGNMTLKNLLILAEAHPEANLRRYNLENVVKNGRVLHIKLLPKTKRKTLHAK